MIDVYPFMDDMFICEPYCILVGQTSTCKYRVTHLVTYTCLNCPFKVYDDSIGEHVHVITGRGIHSKGREARIKPAVTQYLLHHGYR